MRIYTIGFTKTSAEKFFGRLASSKIRSLVDVRLNNVSQLAGFAKRDDLRYFTNELVRATYIHRTELAPTKDMLDGYKKDRRAWDDYASKFIRLMESRKIEELIPRESLDGACLLCSEDKAHHCHRRLVAEYLRDKWGDVEIVHI